MTRAPEVLRQILETADVDHAACATAMGLSESVFAEMLAGQREIPDSLVPLIAAVVGVHESELTSSVPESRKSDVVPAIWYKLRDSRLSQVDREYILVLRQLAFYEHELECVTDSRSVAWQALFEQIRRETNPQASPTEQGRSAARLFRRASGLDVGARGIGEVFRSFLRNIGVLVIESSDPDSVLDGCSFYVGPSKAVRPCVFANSYRTTWFRRNRILAHELAHAIFDVESAIATLDYAEDPAAGADSVDRVKSEAASQILPGSSTDPVQERRADAFAQELLVPAEVLRHVAQLQRIRWDTRNANDVAKLVAETHVEQRLLAKAMEDAELVDAATREFCETCDIGSDLRALSSHALSTGEFVRREGVEASWVKGRTTTTAPRKLLLPSRYVAAVVAAFKSRVISRGKASRMLMIDEHEFQDRFAKEELQPID